MNTSLENIMPVPKPYTSNKRAPRKRPPSLVYTSPESMKYILSADKDAKESDDVQVVSVAEAPKRKRQKQTPPVTRGGRGRGRPQAARKSTQSSGPTVGSALPSRGRGRGRGAASGRQALQQRSQNVIRPASDPTIDPVGTESGLLPVVQAKEGFTCVLCHTGLDDCVLADEDYRWVYCPRCRMVVHAMCFRVLRCICGFKPKKSQIQA